MKIDQLCFVVKSRRLVSKFWIDSLVSPSRLVVLTPSRSTIILEVQPYLFRIENVVDAIDHDAQALDNLGALEPLSDTERPGAGTWSNVNVGCYLQPAVSPINRLGCTMSLFSVMSSAYGKQYVRMRVMDITPYQLAFVESDPHWIIMV